MCLDTEKLTEAVERLQSLEAGEPGENQRLGPLDPRCAGQSVLTALDNFKEKSRGLVLQGRWTDVNVNVEVGGIMVGGKVCGGYKGTEEGLKTALKWGLLWPAHVL